MVDRITKLFVPVFIMLALQGCASTTPPVDISIVRVFGYQEPHGIDSVQLEFGANWRATPERIEQTATIVADALIAHLRAAGYK